MLGLFIYNICPAKSVYITYSLLSLFIYNLCRARSVYITYGLLGPFPNIFGFSFFITT